MKRREFMTLMGGAATVWPLAARAQQRERMRRIGVLESYNESDPQQRLLTAAFVGGLQKLGWTAGANVMIDYRWGGGDSDRIRLYAAELTGLHPDVILSAGPLPLLALKRATRIIPIVFTNVYDPLGSGFVASLTRPGGNITGFTLGEFSMGGKILEVLKQVAPQVSRVAVVLNLEQPPNVAMWRTIEAAASSLGTQLDQAADGHRKRRLVLLLFRPVPYVALERFVDSDANHRVAARSRTAAPFTSVATGWFCCCVRAWLRLASDIGGFSEPTHSIRFQRI